MLALKCTKCKYENKKDGKVAVTLQRNKSIIIIKQVPASFCKNCGEYTLEEAVTRKTIDIAERAVASNAEVEILQYAA